MAAAKLFLIDAHALCYRSFFAIRDLATSKGQKTNAILGFVNTLRKILREYQPEYVAVCFDSRGKTYRQEKYNAYKIQRPLMPQDLIDQMPLIKDIVAAYNLAIFECPGFEADDIIATICHALREDNLQVVIVSDDKDMYQLADSHTVFFSARKDLLREASKLAEDLGFDPRQMTDFIALAGDPSDNIPGVKGIGEVTARQLIGRYGNLENILQHLDDIKPQKVQEKLRAGREQAVLSKELAVLTTNVPIRLSLGCLEVKSGDRKQLLSLFQELEFHKFVRELNGEGAGSSNQTLTPLPQAKADIATIMKWIEAHGQVVLVPHLEPSEKGLIPKGIIIGAGDEYQFFVPLDQLDDWKEIFGQKTVLKITYNLKEIIKMLTKQECVLLGKTFDVLLGGYLAGVSPASLTPAGLASRYLHKTFIAGQDATQEAGALEEVYPLMSKELQEKSLIRLLEEIEIPLANVLADMEGYGVRLDLKLLEGMSKECDRKIQDLTGRLYAIAGEEFNLNSPKQLSHVLFERLRLPTLRKTKTGFSTNEEVLTILAGQHEFPALILEYRQLAKLKSTYIDALPKLVNTATGRIHAQFNQTGTETGRLSSSQPNLQNIPIRTELGRQIRKAFIPLEPGHILVAADYSQIELRILAHFSEDPVLRKAFEENQDIHAFTASLIFDMPEKNLPAAMRDTAKRVNFGIIYGMSAFGLSKDLGISQEDAQEFIEKYFLRYPRVRDFMEQTILQCRKQGFVTTLLNRRRYIPEINSANESIRLFAQRQAINTPVQGSAADLIKLAMIDIHKEIRRRKLACRILISVHDELVLDCPAPEKTAVVELLRERMEHPLELSVPIKVTIRTGANWLEMKEV